MRLPVGRAGQQSAPAAPPSPSGLLPVADLVVTGNLGRNTTGRKALPAGALPAPGRSSADGRRLPSCLNSAWPGSGAESGTAPDCGNRRPHPRARAPTEGQPLGNTSPVSNSVLRSLRRGIRRWGSPASAELGREAVHRSVDRGDLDVGDPAGGAGGDHGLVRGPQRRPHRVGLAL